MQYIKFQTQTQAEKAASVLRQKGFTLRVRRNPSPNKREGCTFAVFVAESPFKALEILESYGINGGIIENSGENHDLS